MKKRFCEEAVGKFSSRWSPRMGLLWRGLLLVVVAGCSGETNQSFLETGMINLKEGNNAAAVGLFDKAIVRDSGNVSAYCNLGIAQWELGQNQRALDALKRAAELCPDDPHPAEFMGYVYIEQRQFPEARKAFEEADKRAPLTPRIITCRALVEYHAGEFRKAVPYLKKALEVDRNYAPALYNLGFLYRGRPDTRAEAARYFKEFLQIAARLPEDQASTEEIQRRVQLAKEFLNLATKSTPEKKTLAPGVPRVEPLKPAENPSPPPPPPPVRAVDSVPSEPPESTVPATKPRESIPTQNGKSVSLPATEALIKSSRAAVATESYDAALEYLREAVRKDPRSADALWELAQLYEKHLQYAKDAAQTYRKFKDLFPNDPRAIARSPAPNTVSAEKPRDTRKAMDLWGKGFALQRQGDVDGAIGFYKRALEADDSLVSAWYNLGLGYRARNELAAAETAFAKAAALSPTMTEAHYMLGWVCFKQKNKTQATESLNRALAINPNYANAHCLLGFIYREDKQIKKARQHLERYLQLAPTDDPTAREVKAWLDQAPRT